MRAIVDLPEVQIAALSILEAKRNTTRAHLVREAIEQYLKNELLPDNAAFGAWQRAERADDEQSESSAAVRDGVQMQQAFRAEWDR